MPYLINLLEEEQKINKIVFIVEEFSVEKFKIIL